MSQSIRVLIIHHAEGIDLAIANTDAERDRQLENWARYWWQTEKATRDIPIPRKPGDIIDQYFRLTEEWWETRVITDDPLNPQPEL